MGPTRTTRGGEIGESKGSRHLESLARVLLTEARNRLGIEPRAAEELQFPMERGGRTENPANTTPPWSISGGVLVRNRKTRFAVGAGLAVILAGLWYAGGRGQERALHDAGDDSSSVHPASSAAAQLAAATDDNTDSARTGQSQTGQSRRTSVDAPTESAAPASAVRLHGTIVVFGGGQFIGYGLEHAQEDGLLKLEALDGDTPGEVAVPVTGGAWSLEVESDVRYRVVGATLGVRPTRVDDAPVLRASDAPIELSARWVTDVVLHVVDAELGIELDSVDVLVQESWEDRWVHPAGASLESAVITGTSSPVLIEVSSGRFRVRVRARGYAWADVELDLDQGAERTVELSRAASLVVITDADEIELPVQVRLYPGGWDSADPAYVALDVVPGRPTLFENLEPGDHQVRVEFGFWQDPPTILARREVTLAPGETKTVTLTTDADLFVPRPAALAGTLELPAGANELGVELQVRPTRGPGWRASDKQRISLARMRALGDGKTYRWDAGEVSSGRVNLIVHPLQVSVVIELPPAGDRAVHLEVAELAHVLVSVVDRSSGEPLPVEMYVAWSKFEPTHRHQLPDDPGSLAERSVAPENIEPDGPGRASFYAPIGRTLVAVGYAGYEEESRWVEILPGQNEVDFALAPLPTLVVGFLDGDELVPAPRGLTVRAVDGDSEWQVWASVGGRLLGIFEEPGQYLVRASHEAEYVFPPREVRIRLGERIEVDIAVRQNR